MYRISNMLRRQRDASLLLRALFRDDAPGAERVADPAGRASVQRGVSSEVCTYELLMGPAERGGDAFETPGSADRIPQGVSPRKSLETN